MLKSGHGPPRAFTISGCINVKDFTESQFGSVACPGLCVRIEDDIHGHSMRSETKQERAALVHWWQTGMELNRAILIYFAPLSPYVQLG